MDPLRLERLLSRGMSAVIGVQMGQHPSKPTSRGDAPNLHSLLAPPQAAELLGVAIQTLASWRTMGVGPNFCRAGRLVRYYHQDILEWLQERKTNSTARFGRRG